MNRKSTLFTPHISHTEHIVSRRATCVGHSDGGRLGEGVAPRGQRRRELGRVLERRRAASSQELSLLNLHVLSHRTAGTTVIASGLGEGHAPGEDHSAPGDEYGSEPVALIKGRRGGAGDAELVALPACTAKKAAL